LKSVFTALALSILFVGTAQAQFEQQQGEQQQQFDKSPTLFEKGLERRAYVYGKNLAENSNDRLFNGVFKTDPKLILGVEISPNWALEAGYVPLIDRGFHKVDERDTGDTAGALGANGSSTHAAVKYSLPLSDRLSAYGKVGVGHSDVRSGGGASQTGIYTGAGAKLKVNERTTVGGEYGSHGGGLKSFGNSNSNSIKADVGIRF
jgi:opacity protein-like surface antigen